MWSSTSSLLTGKSDAFSRRPGRLVRGKLRLDIPFNAALDILTSNNDELFEAAGPFRFKCSVEPEEDSPRLDTLLSDTDESPLSKRSGEGLKKRLETLEERDERRVLKKSNSRKLEPMPDVTAGHVEIMKATEKPTVASEVMEALRFAVGKDAEEDALQRRNPLTTILPEGRRRSALPISAGDPRRGSKQSCAASRRASQRSLEDGRASVTSLSSALSELSSRERPKPRSQGARPSKKASAIAVVPRPEPRMARRRMPRSRPMGEHRSEAWLARDTGLPLSVLQQSLAYFKKYVPEYDGRNLFDVKFDMKHFAKVLCELAGVDHVDQLERSFVAEAFRQADFDQSGGIDCVEFVLWFSAFGFSQYFCVTKEDLPHRNLARKLGVDYIELERYKQAFDKYDEDGSGAIDMDEFECLLTDLLKVPAGHSLSAERIMVLWRDADREQEGELDLEAFCGFFKRHFDDAENSICDYYRSIRRIPTAQLSLSRALHVNA